MTQVRTARRGATLGLLAATLLAGTTTGCGYNTIQTLDERVNQAQGQIQAQLQRRSDLIPNLVQTVKGITKQEDTVFISIANARSRLTGAVQSGNVTEMANANAQLNAGLGRLIAISEAYPQLQSSQNFRDLQSQLEGTENRVAVARTDYNAAVNDYNAYIRRFPNNLTARVFGLGKSRPYFQASTEAQQGPPGVKF
jgi:LemA protein